MPSGAFSTLLRASVSIRHLAKRIHPILPQKKKQGKFPLGLTFPGVNSIYCCLKEVQLP